jgi:hypothetical protein
VEGIQHGQVVIYQANAAEGRACDGQGEWIQVSHKRSAGWGQKDPTYKDGRRGSQWLDTPRANRAGNGGNLQIMALEDRVLRRNGPRLKPSGSLNGLLGQLVGEISEGTTMHHDPDLNREASEDIEQVSCDGVHHPAPPPAKVPRGCHQLPST